MLRIEEKYIAYTPINIAFKNISLNEIQHFLEKNGWKVPHFPLASNQSIPYTKPLTLKKRLSASSTIDTRVSTTIAKISSEFLCGFSTDLEYRSIQIRRMFRSLSY
jgi:hypothetical protein